MNSKIISITFFLIILLVFGSSSLFSEEKSLAVEIILDASGSMNGKLKTGELKIVAAKGALKSVVENLPDDILLAFRAYGHQSHRKKKDCDDTQLIVPFSESAKVKKEIVDKSSVLKAQGYTPITRVLTLAAEDFPSDKELQKTIVLISDGKETCKGDPCAAVRALRKKGIDLTVHTIGLGVDVATKSQLECIATASGGKYFGAGNEAELKDVLSKAVRTAAVKVVVKEGEGKLRVVGADLSGHKVYNAETGEKMPKTISRVNSTIVLPEGIYNISVGKAMWKSIMVKTGETTVLEPGWLTVRGAALTGHKVIEIETLESHGSVSSLKSTIALMPGTYDVMFKSIPWRIEIIKGGTVTLEPGSIHVAGAHYRGHAIKDSAGVVVGKVSNTMSSMPLPPGKYTIEIDGKTEPFTIEKGGQVKFKR